MLNVGLLDIVELFLAGLILIVAVGVKEVLVLVTVLHNVKRHFEAAVLELYDEVHEDLVLEPTHRELFPDFPEFFGDPVSNYGDVLQVVDVRTYVYYLLGEHPRQPELTP